MRCSKCNGRAVFEEPRLCEKHFTEEFENTVKRTIRKFGLIKKGERVAVACSGGKDSSVLLHVLKKLGYNVTAIAVDEGIKGYRDRTLRDLREFCSKEGVELRIHSFREEFGGGLDAMKRKSHENPCTLCGVWRRKILNKAARGFDVIAAGHNLDDECQSIIMNLLTNKTDVLARLGPVTGVVESKGFSKRVKPLYFLAEKEVMAYSFLNSISTDFTECPYAHLSFRSAVRDELNRLEARKRGTKKRTVYEFLKILPKLKEQHRKGAVSVCGKCGEPSSGRECKSCRILAAAT